jgi:hypothetical protein
MSIHNNKQMAIVLFFLAIIISGCGKSNERKKDFIKENIQKTNNRNIRKHNELIIPDFILNYDETENTKN